MICCLGVLGKLEMPRAVEHINAQIQQFNQPNIPAIHAAPPGPALADNGVAGAAAIGNEGGAGAPPRRAPPAVAGADDGAALHGRDAAQVPEVANQPVRRPKP